MVIRSIRGSRAILLAGLVFAPSAALAAQATTSAGPVAAPLESRLGPSVPTPNPVTSAVPEGVAPARNADVLALSGDVSVGLHNGELYCRATDLALPGVGLDFVFGRAYRSQVSYNGPLGRNWTHSFDQWVFLQNGVLKHVGDRFQVDSYPGAGGPVRNCATPGVYRKARVEADGSWRIRDRAGTILVFRPLDGSPAAGRLSEIQDRHGNFIACAYGASGRLERVTDTLGRTVVFEYGALGRIHRVTDPIGRSWTYGYDALGNLVSVTSPPIVGGPVGPAGQNDFPQGVATRYKYSVSGNALLRNNLVQVVRPNEAAANGPAAVTLTYAADRVASASIGGVNASGIAAGGTFQFLYQPSSEGGEVAQTRVTDPDGFVQVHGFDPAGSLLRHEILKPGGGSFRNDFQINALGEVVQRTTPAGNVYENEFDEVNPDHFQRGNVVKARHVPAPGAAGVAKTAASSPVFEPVYNQQLTTAESGELVWLDYQEDDPQANGLTALATDWDIQAILSGAFPVGLAQDLNGDGQVNQIGGNVTVRQSKLISTGVPAPVRAESVFTYDSRGRMVSRANAIGRLDYFFYGPDGLLLAEARDAPPFAAPNAGTAHWNKPPSVAHVAAIRIHERDAIGRVVRTTDPRGVQTTFTYDVLDRVVLEVTGSGSQPPSGSPSLDARLAALANAGLGHVVAPGIETWFRRDANGNVVRIDRETFGTGQQGNPWLTSTSVRDILDRVVREEREIDAASTSAVDLRYDGRGNVVSRTKPAGNFDTWSYDERGLLAQEVRGASHSATAATTNYVRDPVGRVVEVIGPEDLDGDGHREKTFHVYDGRGRAIEGTDPVGSTWRRQYDAFDRPTKVEFLGRLGGPSPTANDSSGNVLLAETVFAYDEVGRRVQTQEHIFVPGAPQLPYAPPDHWRFTYVEYDLADNVTNVTDSQGFATHYAHDGLDRIIRIQDPVGNVAGLTYDAGDNLLVYQLAEAGPSGESKRFSFVYDGLGRRIRATDILGRASYTAFDARGIAVAEADAHGPVVASDPWGIDAGPINTSGATKRFVLDGLGRMTATRADLYQGGAGIGLDLFAPGFDPAADPPPGSLDLSANPDGVLRTSIAYDANGNVVQVTDDTEKSLLFEYDHQDRQVRKQFPDGSALVTTYWKDGSVRDLSIVASSGAPFRTIRSSYDGAARVIDEQVILPSGSAIEGSTGRTFEYDGLHRTTLFTDDNGGAPHLVSTVARHYDSLGRVLLEDQNGEVVANDYDVLGNRSGLWYPNGRHVSFTHDSLSRISQLREGSASGGGPILATYSYFGPDRVARVVLGNGVSQSFETPKTGSGWLTGYDPAGLPARLRHEGANGAALTDLVHDFDRAGKRLNEWRTFGGGAPLQDAMAYDSAGRLERFERDAPSGGAPAVANAYRYEGDSTWDSLTIEKAGQGPSTYDFVTNEVWSYDSIAGNPLTTDLAGNGTGDPWFHYRYDAFDRLVRVVQKLPGGGEGQAILRFSYDALGRRIEKVAFDGLSWFARTRFVLDGDRVIEEQDGQGGVLAQYVHGTWIDELLQMRRDADGNGSLEDYYALANTLGSVVGLCDAGGQVVVRYGYDAFGAPTFLAPDGTPLVDSGGNSLIGCPLGNPYLFQGREYDVETAAWKKLLGAGGFAYGYFAEWSHAIGKYYFRARYTDPMRGSFVSRDVLSAATNRTSLDVPSIIERLSIDAYSEAPNIASRNNPLNELDPLGEDGRKNNSANCNTHRDAKGRFTKPPLKPGAGLVKGGLAAGGAQSVVDMAARKSLDPKKCDFASRTGAVVWAGISLLPFVDKTDCESARLNLLHNGDTTECESVMLVAMGYKCSPSGPASGNPGVPTGPGGPGPRTGNPDGPSGPGAPGPGTGNPTGPSGPGGPGPGTGNPTGPSGPGAPGPTTGGTSGPSGPAAPGPTTGGQSPPASGGPTTGAPAGSASTLVCVGGVMLNWCGAVASMKGPFIGSGGPWCGDAVSAKGGDVFEVACFNPNYMEEGGGTPGGTGMDAPVRPDLRGLRIERRGDLVEVAFATDRLDSCQYDVFRLDAASGRETSVASGTARPRSLVRVHDRQPGADPRYVVTLHDAGGVIGTTEPVSAIVRPLSDPPARETRLQHAGAGPRSWPVALFLMVIAGVVAAVATSRFLRP